MMKKMVILTASLFLSSCGLNDPLYTPKGDWPAEEYLGHKIYNGYVYENCALYNRETRLSYFAKNKIMFIPALGQFSVYDKTSPFGSPMDSPKMVAEMRTQDIYLFVADKGPFNYKIVDPAFGEMVEFTIAHRDTNKFVIYQCGKRAATEARIVSELFTVY